jgi:16S rRNA (cytosine1402-N4)-methyltransferase
VNTSDPYHIPVLLNECMSTLNLESGDVFLDGTMGGGGHFFECAKRLGETGIAVGLDRDPEAVARVQSAIPQEVMARTIIMQARFSDIDTVVRTRNLPPFDAVLLDLGVSSRQIDSASRGFSYSNDAAPLDMRMDPTAGITATQLVAQTSEHELAHMLEAFGEVHNAGRMAETIKRGDGSPRTAGELKERLASEYGDNLRPKMLSKLFQALRIAVNGELDELETFLRKIGALLALGGRCAIISYHSLEDRLVKRTFLDWEQNGTSDAGSGVFKFKRITKKVIMPSHHETTTNRRSRSAKLRVVERVA